MAWAAVTLTDQVPASTVVVKLSSVWLAASRSVTLTGWPSSASRVVRVMAKPARASAALTVLSVAIGLIAMAGAMVSTVKLPVLAAAPGLPAGSVWVAAGAAAPARGG